MTDVSTPSDWHFDACAASGGVHPIIQAARAHASAPFYHFLPAARPINTALAITMDAFEELVASFLRNRGYWVESCLKVKLHKNEKVAIGRSSSPRWELDLVAYKPSPNELLVVECKSFLDSRGVSMASFAPNLASDRYKLFNEPKLREVVFGRLVKQLAEQGSIHGEPRVQLCLAAGRIKSSKDRDALLGHFSSNGWRLLDKAWLCAEMEALSQESYQNSVSSVVSKLLLREREV